MKLPFLNTCMSMCQPSPERTRVSAGTTGEVVRSKHSKYGPIVEKRVYWPSQHNGKNLLDTFEAEAEALSVLHHPNVVQVLKINRPKRTLVMKDGGESLQTKMAAGERIRIKRVLRQVLAAIAYCQQQGYLHSDIKPDNIVVDSNDIVTLIDFGFAQHAQNATDPFPFNHPRGAPFFLSPERATRASYGFNADVWSVGIILYTLVTHQPLFEVNTVEEALQKIRSWNEEFPHAVSDKFKTLLQEILIKDKERRPEAQAILDKLDAPLSKT